MLSLKKTENIIHVTQYVNYKNDSISHIEVFIKVEFIQFAKNLSF